MNAKPIHGQKPRSGRLQISIDFSQGTQAPGFLLRLDMLCRRV